MLVGLLKKDNVLYSIPNIIPVKKPSYVPYDSKISYTETLNCSSYFLIRRT